MSHNYLKVWAVIAFLVPSIPALAGYDEELKRLDRTSARDTAQFFVEKEFNGERLVRKDLAVFTEQSKEGRRDRQGQWRNKSANYQYRRELFYEFEEIVLVSRWQLDEVVVEDHRGYATVVYDRLGRSEGEFLDRRLKDDRRKNDKIILLLVQDADDHRWYIANPPPWRVSFQFLRQAYAQDLEQYAQIEKSRELDPALQRMIEMMRDDADTMRSIQLTPD
ncbi:MAG: hypothetical protein HQL51_13855 [Magnetococcales bacterium]|nr:hypothetical protein [Magnetococcales bacterium]